MNVLSTIEKNSTTEPEIAFDTAREIIQEAILCALYRSNFFSHVAFHGGTSLRIFHGLDRFSEDLDFCVVDDGYEVDYDKIYSYVSNELESLGLDYTMTKVRRGDDNINGCYIEGNAVDTLVLMGYPENIVKQIHPKTHLKV